MGYAIPASHGLYAMKDEPRDKSHGGASEHLLPEEIELILECYKTRRTAGFVAALLECSPRSVNRYFARYRAKGVLFHPISLDEVENTDG